MNIKRYDPKYSQLQDGIEKFEASHPSPELLLWLWAALLALLLIALFHFVFHWLLDESTILLPSKGCGKG